MSHPRLPSVIDRVLSPGRFFVPPPGRPRIAHVPEEHVRWEVYLGHLLDESQTRAVQTFEAWHVFIDPGDEQAATPLVSVRYSPSENQLHVSRNILIYATEAYESAPDIIATRTVERWKPERIGGLDLDRVGGSDDLERLASDLVFAAVVGTSRLPITSPESPLPAYSLGTLAYAPAEPLAKTAQLVAALRTDLAEHRRARLLEAAIRAATDDGIGELIAALFEHLDSGQSASVRIPALFREIFNQVSLAPYTGFVDRWLAIFQKLAADARIGPEPILDCLGYMLRHLVRHLTAFDLVTFHNRGANYPDALFLDALLKTFLDLLASQGESTLAARDQPPHIRRVARLRRRALRQACIVRRQYEGRSVPDAPTSPGENQRVLPAALARVPEEQIGDEHTRTRVLFADEPLKSLLSDGHLAALAASIDDLSDPRELGELGMASFLDRPLGTLKHPAEIDRTPLLSYEAFSKKVARRRLHELHAAGWIESRERLEQLLASLDRLDLLGVRVMELPAAERPGVVALEDARKASDDFVFLRTTRRSIDEFLRQYDFDPLLKVAPDVHAWLHSGVPLLLIRTSPIAPLQPGPVILTAYDQADQPRLQLATAQHADETTPYLEVAAREFVRHGLQVRAITVQVRENEHLDLQPLNEPVILPAKI